MTDVGPWGMGEDCSCGEGLLISHKDGKVTLAVGNLDNISKIEAKIVISNKEAFIGQS